MEPINSLLDKDESLPTTPIMRVNQIAQRHGVQGTVTYFVVYEIEKTHSGYLYKLINVENKKFDSTRNPIPLSKQQYQAGTFFNDEPPEFMMKSLVTQLHQEANALISRQNTEKERKKEIEKIGTQCLNENIPPEAKGIIVAVLYQKDSTSHSDDPPRKILRAVILGFSTLTKRSIPELRKMAAHFPETQHLSEKNSKFLQYNHTLGEKYEDGWNVFKEILYSGNAFIRRYAEFAANPDNIHLLTTK